MGNFELTKILTFLLAIGNIWLIFMYVERRIMENSITLRTWLKQERGRLTKMANALELNYSWISQIASGKKKAPLETAIRISAFTQNEVTVETINAAYQENKLQK